MGWKELGGQKMKEYNFDQMVAIEDYTRSLKKQLKKYKERMALGIVDEQLGLAQRKFDKFADRMAEEEECVFQFKG